MTDTPRREDTRYVEDSASLRAVAHPLRMQMLGHLRTSGPATASALARVLGESSGSTSYHLRQLQRFGFVEPDPEQPSRREKVWRAAHRSTNVGMWEGAGPGEQAAIDTIVAVQVEHLLEGVRRRQREAPTTPKEWSDAHASSDFLLRVTADRMRRLKQEIVDLVDAAQCPDDPDARWVQLHLQSFSMEEPPAEGQAAEEQAAEEQAAEEQAAEERDR